ncbi:hypothetical protein AC579_246 [Pseudocercospora musae]|uniref:Uncharacterized protein n=1 Tax=Pseudocercospora musae TaxID=113226 RepID=A0A139I0D3_9PEZI|nr:hypothetical protein AC579_246 [Pseudocercospora musae]
MLTVDRVDATVEEKRKAGSEKLVEMRRALPRHCQDMRLRTFNTASARKMLDEHRYSYIWRVMAGKGEYRPCFTCSSWPRWPMWPTRASRTHHGSIGKPLAEMIRHFIDDDHVHSRTLPTERTERFSALH